MLVLKMRVSSEQHRKNIVAWLACVEGGNEVGSLGRVFGLSKKIYPVKWRGNFQIEKKDFRVKGGILKNWVLWVK